MPSSLPVNTAALRLCDLLVKGAVEQFIPAIAVPIPSVQPFTGIAGATIFHGVPPHLPCPR